MSMQESSYTGDNFSNQEKKKKRECINIYEVMSGTEK